MFSNFIANIVHSPIGDTPADWISIDSKAGVIEVLANREIGCDVPKRDDLKYFIKLSDGKFETSGEVRARKSFKFLKIFIFFP